MSVFKDSNDQLSRKASEVYREFQAEAEDWADMHAWHAPSECGALIAESHKKVIKAIFNNNVEEAVDFICQLERRTTPKWVYFSGFYDVLDVFPYIEVEKALQEWRINHPIESSAVTVMNLATTDKQLFTCLPEQAVIAAYAQSLGDWNTWDYTEKYGHLLLRGKHTVSCGDFSAYYCSCHSHKF